MDLKRGFRLLCLVSLLVLASCHRTGANKSADVCSPLGDPIPSGLSGANAFDLCKVGDHLNTVNWGPVTQNYIKCKPNTLRANFKWVIYCNAEGSHCACNREGIIASPSDLTCCAFKAGDHCTVNGEARPGRNG